MRNLVLIMALLLSCIRGGAVEPIDTLSYSLGYTVTISLFAGENPLVTNEEEFSRYIAGIEENINIVPNVDANEEFLGLNSDDPSFRISYSLGGMQAVFLFDGLEGRDASRMPPVDCIVAGLREVAEGRIVLPVDTVEASKVINSYGSDLDPLTLEGERRCEFFKAYGIMKAMTPDIQEFIQGMAPEKGLIADRKAYAMGMANYLEEASRVRVPENAYDLGKMIADARMIENIPFKLVIPSFIEGARAVWGFGQPLIPFQRMTELLDPYLSGDDW